MDQYGKKLNSKRSTSNIEFPNAAQPPSAVAFDGHFHTSPVLAPIKGKKKFGEGVYYKDKRIDMKKAHILSEGFE